MRVYLPILFDFIKMKLSFKKVKGMSELKGITEARLKIITTIKVHKKLEISNLWFRRIIIFHRNI